MLTPDHFIYDLQHGRACSAAIDGVLVVGRVMSRAVIGRADPAEYATPPIGSAWVLAADLDGWEWRIMEQRTADIATPIAVTIANVDPAECLRRAIRIAAALNGGRDAR